MSILDYLDKSQKKCFSARKPISFKKDEEKYLAYLGRYPIADLDLAIIIGDNEKIYFDVLWKNSLSDYKQNLSENLIKELSEIIRKETVIPPSNDLKNKIR